jgi:hypothetical protein
MKEEINNLASVIHKDLIVSHCSLVLKEFNKLLSPDNVVKTSVNLCECKDPEINDIRWACDKCGNDFNNRYKGGY